MSQYCIYPTHPRYQCPRRCPIQLSKDYESVCVYPASFCRHGRAHGTVFSGFNMPALELVNLLNTSISNGLQLILSWENSYLSQRSIPGDGPVQVGHFMNPVMLGVRPRVQAASEGVVGGDAVAGKESMHHVDRTNCSIKPQIISIFNARNRVQTANQASPICCSNPRTEH